MTAPARRPSGEAGDVHHLQRRSGHDRHRIQFFTVTETAEMLRVSTRTVRRWIDRGELIAHRFGNAVRIAEPDLRAFLGVHRNGF
jgi:excisionase family DNA binding protein